MNQEQLIVTPKWKTIKNMFKQHDNGCREYQSNTFEVGGELDTLCHEFLDIIANLTIGFGYNCVIEGVKMDLWKERIWTIIENAGLLEEISWKTDLEIGSSSDYKNEDEFDEPLPDEEVEKIIPDNIFE
jgi:hypothetical protein